MKKLLLSLAIVSSAHAMEHKKIEPGSLAKVIVGQLKGATAKIEGTSKDIWGIDDVWMSPQSFSIQAIANYLISRPPFARTVYYGKVDLLGYCFHESWLEKIKSPKD